MLEEYGDGTNEDSEDLTSSGKRYGQCDTSADGLMANDYEDCGNYGSQSRIRCHSCTNVHPAQSQHFQSTT